MNAILLLRCFADALKGAMYDIEFRLPSAFELFGFCVNMPELKIKYLRMCANIHAGRGSFFNFIVRRSCYGGFFMVIFGILFSATEEKKQRKKKHKYCVHVCIWQNSCFGILP